MEAGNRCYDERVPEEINRKIVDHLSDINLVLTEHARRYLIKEGLPQERIFKTGSHMPEIINYYKKDILKNKIIKKLNVKKQKYFLVSIHREENVDNKDNLKEIIDSLDHISKKYKLPIIVSTHPRTEKKINEFKLKTNNKQINFVKPFGFLIILICS